MEKTSRRAGLFGLLLVAGLAISCSRGAGENESGPERETGTEPEEPDVWEPDVSDVFGPYGSGSGDATSGEEPSSDTRIRAETGGTPCSTVQFEYSDTTATSVWVTGTFNDWAPTPEEGAMEMSVSDGTWSAETTISDRGRHYYKFIVDGIEWVPDPTNGRQVPDYRGGRRSVVDVCRTRPTPACGTVNFVYRNSAASSVELVGTFTDWEEDPVSLRKVEGVWRTSVELQPGVYEYKFIVDGTWKLDPENDQSVNNGEGGENSLLEIECPT